MSLQKVWEQQFEYNEKIKKLQRRSSSEWMETYILGVMSELGELLQEINWKKHRQERRNDFGPNVAEELADITKFVFSMWQQMGIEPEQMLEFCWQKGQFLDQKYVQEHRPLVENRLVLILDLDGVIADFRNGFELWIEQNPKFSQYLPAIMDEQTATLHMDVNNGWSYPRYSQAKSEFEQTGGYGYLPAIHHNLRDVIEFQKMKPYTVVWTARPGKKLERVWKDTWEWLQRYNIQVDEFHFGREERVQDACRFQEDGNLVIAVEDDPFLAKRYSISNIRTVLIPHSYNSSVQGDRIHRLGEDSTLIQKLSELISLGSVRKEFQNV